MRVFYTPRYHAELGEGHIFPIPFVFQRDPDILFYPGGADPYVGDKLGRLALSIEG